MNTQCFVIITSLSVVISCSSGESFARVKHSNLAGRWYSSDATLLAAQIDRLLADAPKPKSGLTPRILILPHAGYQYSGRTAAAGYRLIGVTGKPAFVPEIIVIIAPSHYSSFNGCSALEADAWETPLGRVGIDRRLAETLRGGVFTNDPSLHEVEHSIEIHLPFIQRIYRDTIERLKILPVLVGSIDETQAQAAAKRLASALAGRSVLYIVSSDFTHYGPRFSFTPFGSGRSAAARVKSLDDGAIDVILKRDAAGFYSYVERRGATICGWKAITIAVSLPIAVSSSRLVAYDTSSSVTGDYSESVSYASIAFFGDAAGLADEAGGLTSQERSFLLRIARENIASWLSKGRGIQIAASSVSAGCRARRGAFVTIKKKGELRGCIGYITPQGTLAQAVIDNSFNAAFRDPRFPPLEKRELNEIRIEISVLTEPTPVRSLDEITPGRDGLIVEKGSMRGLLLPQVAVEQGWGRDEFISHTCLKAGLPASCWKDGDANFYRFQAIVFGEGEER